MSRHAGLLWKAASSLHRFHGWTKMAVAFSLRHMASFSAGLWIAPLLLCMAQACTGQTTIVVPTETSDLERLAAKEIRRYFYLRTGELPRIAETRPPGPAIVVGSKGHQTVRDFCAGDAGLSREVAELGPQQYRIRTLSGPSPTVIIAGGDALGTLYGAYRMAEHLGVRFFLEGDVIADQPIPARLPEIDDRGLPLFETRGIQPFHDFPEGPDWWNLDDYKAIIAQLPKLRLNFIGFHNYPKPEPLVWIGSPEDLDAEGKPRHSYDAWHFTTARAGWGYDPMKTSDYVLGAAGLFDADDHGAEYMRGPSSSAVGEQEYNERFVRVGNLLRDAFSFARRLGVKTCVGTETPLHAPKEVAERMVARNANGQRPWEALGGRLASYPHAIADTDDDAVYQSVRYDMEGYRFTVPNGTYSVTLQFSEVAYERKGARVFHVTIQGRRVLEHLDIWEKVGKDRALDFTFDSVEVRDGALCVEFGRQVEYPCVAGIVICGPQRTVKINCGGGPYMDYVADEGAPFVGQEDRQKLYEGIFLRIKQTHPLDYYWLWTPENWTWRGANPGQIADTEFDLKAALAAIEKVGAPFSLATCGWVLGPQEDRTLFDRLLPKNAPMSCINRQVGWAPVEPGFSRMDGRPKWAIPWLEDDPGQTIPQLWVGRMRRDAADAHAYGCTGLLGIHWRTRVLGPNVAALAAAAWDQSSWNPEAGLRVRVEEPELPEGPQGGQAASFPHLTCSNTDLPELYRNVRYGMSAYRLRIPNGTYTVRLHLAEPHYPDKGKRVFSVYAQGRAMVRKLDMVAAAGKGVAADQSLRGVRVDDGQLIIQFSADGAGAPCVAALSVTGTADAANQFPARPYARKINCGGPAWRDYEADLPSVEPVTASARPRDLASKDFYEDWATRLFGNEAAAEIAAIFARLDGGGSPTGADSKKANLPRPATWVHGPGGILPDKRPWGEVAPSYSFVGELATLRNRVRGAGNLERFDFWLNQFRYLRAMGEHNCVWSQFESALAQAERAVMPEEKGRLAMDQALPIYRHMLALQSDIHRHLLATVSTPGCMGNVANWQQHILFRRRGDNKTLEKVPLLAESADRLRALLGGALPNDARLAQRYAGEPRMFVPTVRGSLEAGEDLNLTVIMLGIDPAEADVLWRPMGGSAQYAPVPLAHSGRGVYRARLDAATIREDLEYHIRVIDKSGRVFFWPPIAPSRSQTVLHMGR